MSGQLTLYVDGYFVNQWDATCFVALIEKQLPFTTSRALLRDGQGVPPALRRLTGTARVPALQHGDFWLTESAAVVGYLEDTFAPPSYPRLLPRDPRPRARALQTMAWLRIELRTLREERPWWMAVYATSSAPPLSPQAERDVADLFELVGYLASTGELAEWNISHVDLALTLARLANTGAQLPVAAQQVLDANRARPSVEAYLHHARPPNPPRSAPG